MRPLGQAMRDLGRELIWMLLYGLFAALIFISFIFGASRIREDFKKARSVSAYRKSDISLLIPQIGAEVHNIPADMKTEAKWQAPQRSLMEILKEGFSRGGKLGSKAELPFGDTELFDSVIIVAGRMIDLSGFEVPQDSDMYFAVSKDLEHMVGSSFEFDGNEFKIEAAVPAGLRIGSLYNSTDTSNVKRTVFVFARDFEKPYRLFWYSPDHFLYSLIAVGASPEEKAELMKAIYQRNGTAPGFVDADEFLKQTGDQGLKYSLLRIVFYAAAAAAAVSAMAMDLARVLQAHRGDYSIHRLFGETKAQVFLRMLFTAAGFNIAPMLYTAKRVMLPTGYEFPGGAAEGEPIKVIMPFSHRAAGIMLLSFGAVLALAAAVVITEYAAFNKQYSKGMRGE